MWAYHFDDAILEDAAIDFMIFVDSHELISKDWPDGLCFKEVCRIADYSWAKVE